MDKLHGQLSSISITQPNEDLKDNMQCPICEEKADKKCSACKSVAYCCVDHQKLDWKNHKKECQPQASSITQPKDDNNSEDIMQCPICQEKADKKCSACKSVSYCCVEHQKLDWKTHKQVCQGFTIKKTDGLGMGWIATRDLKAGVLLLEESPALQAPGWNWKSGSKHYSNLETKHEMIYFKA